MDHQVKTLVSVGIASTEDDHLTIVVAIDDGYKNKGELIKYPLTLLGQLMLSILSAYGIIDFIPETNRIKPVGSSKNIITPRNN